MESRSPPTTWKTTTSTPALCKKPPSNTSCSEREDTMNDPWRNEEPISIYTLAQGIADGLYVEIFKNRWEELSAGKPIVATTALCEAVSLAALREIWNAYVVWRRE